MRVITGKARGCNLKLPSSDDIRPTTDKVKEAVFSTIQFLVEGRSFLDLFAGSGQMGIEALSRGAKNAVFVEKNKKSASVIMENLKHTKLESCSIVQNLDVQSFLLRNKQKFDIIYMDPPYHAGGIIRDTLTQSIQTALKENGVLLCEHTCDFSLDDKIGEFSKVKAYKYGKISVSRYENLSRSEIL